MSPRRDAPLLAAVAMVAAAGLVHGYWTGRWDTPADLNAAAARLSRVPAELEGWSAVDVPIDPRQFEQAEIAGQLLRRYRDLGGGGSVTALLVCGRPGPIAAHTPDVCYVGSGFDAVEEPVRLAWRLEDGREAVFRRGLFRRTGPAGPLALEIHWSWSADGRWDAPDHPKLAYRPRGVLYKLYLIREADPGDPAADPGAARALAARLLPALGPIVFEHP